MTNYTVSDLIAMLEGMDPNAEVRLAHQPSWPFEYSIDDVVEVTPPTIITKAAFDAMSEEEQGYAMEKADEGEAVLIDEGEEEPKTVVYIGEGSQLAYLPGNAARQLGWR